MATGVKWGGVAGGGAWFVVNAHPTKELVPRYEGQPPPA
eukprot:CAMPEP_0205911792 /NCGR_PEP_ID=MMETSP1325-20131115/5392_1 /ASSEMBLY_ACC=CAM_ASM_000708 /TAXON_ID=236786 /ORGANISM="Florenciella sp., Strain RCC1007" /LENGTH=38 /DNA_ID= /DNA_START= /DNA_END= /DNA_ORIENTATION=